MARANFPSDRAVLAPRPLIDANSLSTCGNFDVIRRARQPHTTLQINCPVKEWQGDGGERGLWVSLLPEYGLEGPTLAWKLTPSEAHKWVVI